MKKILFVYIVLFIFSSAYSYEPLKIILIQERTDENSNNFTLNTGFSNLGKSFIFRFEASCNFKLFDKGYLFPKIGYHRGSDMFKDLSYGFGYQIPLFDRFSTPFIELNLVGNNISIQETQNIYMLRAYRYNYNSFSANASLGYKHRFKSTRFGLELKYIISTRYLKDIDYINHKLKNADWKIESYLLFGFTYFFK